MNFTLNNILEFESDESYTLIIGFTAFIFCIIVELYNYIKNYRRNQNISMETDEIEEPINNTETEEMINDDKTENIDDTETEETINDDESDDNEEIYESDESDEMKHVIKMYSFLTRKQLIKLVGVIGRNKRKMELIEMAIEKFRVNMVKIIINQILTKKYIYLNASAQEYLEQHKIEIEDELNDYFENTK